MSGINSASSTSSNSSFISDSSSSQISTTARTTKSAASNPVTVQSPAVLNLLNYSRQFTQGTQSKLYNFPFCFFSQLKAQAAMAHMTNNMSIKNNPMAAASPFTTASVKNNQTEAGQLSEDMVKQHLSQLLKKQGTRSGEFLSDPDSSDIDKNKIYE